MRHNNIRDFETNLLRKVYYDVEVEPHLQPLEGEETLGLRGDEVRPDIRARSLWRRCQNAFFDVRVTNTNTPCQANLSSEQIYKQHENEKKRQYNDRIMNVEHGTFTPLIFSVNGGAGPEATKFHKHIADLISRKTSDPYSKVMAWIRCKLSFIILRACLTCVRGSRPQKIENSAAVASDISFAHDEARIN
jgi:hypothetical protein